MVLDSNRSLLEKAIGLALEAWKLKNDDLFYDKAFSFSEQGKNILLLELIQGNKKNITIDIPDSLLLKENKLNSNIVSLKEELYLNKLKGEKNEELENALFKAKEKFGEINSVYGKRIPRILPIVKYDHSIPSATEIQQALKKEKAHLLEYFVGDSVIYVFHITPSGKYVEYIPLDFSLIDWVNDFRKGLYEYHALPDSLKK